MSQYAEQVKATRNTQDNINPTNSINPILKQHPETIGIRDGPTVIQTLDIGTHFVLDHPVNCDLDSVVYELDTGLGTHTVYSLVSNPSNEFFWNFRHSTGTKSTKGTYDSVDFLSASATATEDTSTNFRADFTSGQVWLTEPICKGSQTITHATITYDSSGTFTTELSANGGSNWESATPGSEHIFTNTGTDLRIRITENAATTGWITNVCVKYRGG